MQYGAESLLPPLVAIVIAIATRRVVVPLGIGVLVGSLLLAQGGPDTTWRQTPVVFYEAMKNSVFTKSHLQALAFSLLLGAMVGVLEKCGGMRSLIARISQRIKSRFGAQTMIATSGLAIFFDDYANTLLLGGTMRATADRYRLSREKLAYLVDSTAAPVAGLAVVSTWAAIEISYMGEGLVAAGITDTSAAFDLFIQSIPYRFYAWFALVTVFLVAFSGRDFGPMRRAEQLANGELPVESAVLPVLDEDWIEGDLLHRWLWSAAVIPVVGCLAVVIGTLIYTGINEVIREYGELAAVDGGGLRLAGVILGNGDAYNSLIAGGLVGLALASMMHLLLSDSSASQIAWSAVLGARQMLPALVILWFAWALSAMTESGRLDTGGYLASVLSDRLDPRLLPTVVFLTAGAMAFSTGTSWGTMGILTPLSISLALQLDATAGPQGAIVLATSGAVLAGAIFGDHCSPISDTTVLSSRASGCDHVAHVRTQMPYALLAGGVSVAIGTIPSAMGLSPWISLLLGTCVLLAAVRFIMKPLRETTA